MHGRLPRQTTPGPLALRQSVYKLLRAHSANHYFAPGERLRLDELLIKLRVIKLRVKLGLMDV